MSQLFLTVLNMSLTASYVILAVMVMRLLLKKAPKGISYGLWSLVAFRLLCPFSFESIFSLMPKNTAYIPQNIIYEQIPEINSGISSVDQFINKRLPMASPATSVNPIQIYIGIGAAIWIIGIIGILLYSLISIRVLKKKLKEAKYLEGNIYEANNLKTPFVLGVIRAKIYLPLGLSDDEKHYILHHEQTHIKRYDHVVKPIGFFILALHWFNPFVWLSFRLMSKDMELSCDEKVLRDLDGQMKKPYANSLLSLAAGKSILNGGPLAFGEGNVKGRIKNVLNYKKAPFWIIILGVIMVMAAGVGLLTNPKSSSDSQKDTSFLGTYEYDELLYTHPLISYYPVGGAGYLYTLSEENFIIIDEKTGDLSENISSILWSEVNGETSNILWSGEKISQGQWEAMFEPDISVPDIRGLDKNSKTMFVISDKYRLFKMGKEIWLAELSENKILIIYSLSRLDLQVEQEESAVQGIIEPTNAQSFVDQTTGADMGMLDYASDDKIVFHGYFGLYVYDLKKREIIRSLDLQAINCSATQGDDYCDVVVSKDGNTVQLHPMSSENMYVYTVSDNTLKSTVYKEMEDSFRENFVFMEDVREKIDFPLGAGAYAYNVVELKNNELGYLYSTKGTLGTLYYRGGGKLYNLFGDDTVVSFVKSVSPAGIVITYENPTGKQVLYGESHILERLGGMEWINIPLRPGAAWHDIQNRLGPDQFVEESININTMHGELDSGYYRIIKPMKIDSTYIDVITEFDIVKDVIILD